MTTIPTRMHGAIDYGVAALFAGLARSRGLPRPVRYLLGTAGAYHAGYSLITDYEAGVRPAIGMRTHLVLDALGGMALLAAGAAMKRERSGARALLVGAGLAELAVMAMSRGVAPLQGPGTGSLVGRMAGWAGEGVAYPPLDVPKPVADGVWVVDSVLPGPVGKVLGARMTVLRLRNGELILHSPTRFSPGLWRALERLGRIRHLVAPSLAHLSFIDDWREACPRAITWAAPGVAQRGKIRIDRELGRAAPGEWRGEVGLVMVPGAAGFHEAALFHGRSGTLVLTDLVLNLEPRKVPALLRPQVRWFGSLAPDGMPPPYLRALMHLGGPAFTAAARQLVALRPGAGGVLAWTVVRARRAERLRRSLRWALS